MAGSIYEEKWSVTVNMLPADTSNTMKNNDACKWKKQQTSEDYWTLNADVSWDYKCKDIFGLLLLSICINTNFENMIIFE